MLGLRVYAEVTGYANSGKVEALRLQLHTGNDSMQNMLGKKEKTLVISLSKDGKARDVDDIMFMSPDVRKPFILHGVYGLYNTATHEAEIE